MQQETAEGAAKGDVLQRIAGVSLVVGGILLIVFNALFPRADDPSDIPQVLTKLADNETLTLLTFLLLAVGMWALMIGMAGVYRSISTGAAAAWARLGFYGVIVGTTLFTVSTAVGLVGTGAAADWVAAGKAMDTSSYSIAATLNQVGSSIFYMFIIVNWLALAFLAVGMVLSSIYPKWLSWALLILGVAMVVVVGIPQALSDPNQALDVTFAILAGLTTLVALVLGIIITRRQIQLM